MDKQQENDLLARLADEKFRRKAFEDLVNAFSESLYWQIRKMVLNHDDANDVLQNTLIKVWGNIDQFRESPGCQPGCSG